MPRAKKPLAEGDPNASRLASHQKFSKTITGRIRKTADGGIQKGGKRNGDGNTSRSNRSTARNKSPDTAITSPPEALLPEKERWPTSPLKLTTNSRLRFHMRGSKYLGHIDTDASSYTDEGHGNRDGSGSTDKGRTIHGREINYKTKDNSKLRVLLSDRLLPTSGTRKELISRLEKSSFDYNTYSSEQLTELLKARHVTNAATGPKHVKIQRLVLNDAVDRDTANWDDTKLYVDADVKKWSLDLLVARQGAILSGAEKPYSTSTWTLKKLGALLKERKLPLAGTREEIVERLQSCDRQRLTEDIAKARGEFHSAKERLEKQVGHPVEDADVFGQETEEDLKAVDNQVERDAVNSRPQIPICDYDWRESHWASRSGRELWDICQRRGMPGHGPRAALLKWLDTGSVEYEDLYAGSLGVICYRRWIKHRSGEKKVDLIRRLKEADEQESGN